MSQFLNQHLQSVVKGFIYNVMNTQNFLEKLKHLGKVPSNATLVKADVVGLYPSMHHEACLKVLYEKLEKTSYLVNMAEFVLKNHFEL